VTKWTAKEIPSLAGQLAVVTGANSGIGWHTALELARAGGEVILTGAAWPAKNSAAVENKALNVI
jgi:NAD(P)-dependent dehydrogenase (short-subunit alcohol dehydrogenase family)